jgi:outer membrane protein TolC
MVFSYASSLTLDEAIHIYKNSDKYNYHLIDKSSMKSDLNASNRNYWFNLSFDSTFIYHNINNLSFEDVSNINSRFWLLEAQISLDYKNSFSKIIFSNPTFSVNIMDLIFYNKNKYSYDISSFNEKIEEVKSKASIRSDIENIIDTYVYIHKLEENRNIKYISLEHLEQDREFMHLKEKMGTVSKLDLDLSDIEILNLQKAINDISREIKINKIKLCNILNIIYIENMGISSFEAEDLEIIVSDEEIIVLENQLKKSEIALKQSFRSTIPDLSLGVTLSQTNDYKPIFRANVAYSLENFSDSLKRSKNEVEKAKISLKDAKDRKNIALISKTSEFDSLVDALKTAQKSMEYFSRIADINRDKYRQNLVSFQEYMNHYNKYREQVVIYNEKEHDIKAFKRKLKLLYE